MFKISKILCILDFFYKKIVLYFVRLIEMIYYKFIYWKSLFLERYMMC